MSLARLITQPYKVSLFLKQVMKIMKAALKKNNNNN